MIKYQLRGLIHSGLAAIEWQMLEVMQRSKIPDARDIAELQELKKLYQKYAELMSPQAQYRLYPRASRNIRRIKT